MFRFKLNFYKELKLKPIMWCQYSSSATADDVIFREVKNKLQIGVVTLNRPKALNSFTLPMTKKVYPQFKKWESQMAFVISKGSGEKAFSAGADIRGLYPDSGASYFLSRLPDQYGIYMGLTGYRVTGLDVLKSGLATHYCDFNKMPSLEQELLNVSSITEIPQVLNKYTQESLKDKDRSFSLQNKNISQHFSADSVESIIKSLKNENSDWSNKQVETLMKLSPTSVKAALYVLRQGKNWSLKECLKMDYRAIIRMFYEKDFAEGVRATLIDRDNNPKWDPATLEAVDESKILSFFKPLPPEKELKL